METPKEPSVADEGNDTVVAAATAEAGFAIVVVDVDLDLLAGFLDSRGCRLVSSSVTDDSDVKRWRLLGLTRLIIVPPPNDVGDGIYVGSEAVLEVSSLSLFVVMMDIESSSSQLEVMRNGVRNTMISWFDFLMRVTLRYLSQYV
mmetsp:Transcript_17892/g.36848  ORF Transcript_17892/g.36848 Transcript_17892/m.36848 type:complete len:145 (+) Transcript_17892:1648-2082(+)